MLAGVTSPYVVALLVCLLLVVAVAVVVWRHRPEAGATELTLLLVATLVWAGVYAAGLVTYDDSLRRLLERVMWIGVTTVPVAWLAFALAYTGHRRWRTARVLGGLLAVSAAVTALVFTNPAHRLVWASNDPVTEAGVVIAVQSYGPLFWPVALFFYALVLVGAYLLLRLVVTTESMYVDQSAALVVGAVVPVLANVLSVLGVAPLPGLDMTPYAFSVSGVAFGYAVVRYDLFEFVPATRLLGRDAVIDNMRDAVLIVDDEHRVVETNPVAEYAFDVDREAVLGEPLAAVLGESVSLPAADERREITTTRRRRTFEMTASPLADWRDRTLGHVLVFRDVTERTLREQRLSVFNRIFRHNLRNDLTVVDGHAEALADELGPPTVDHAEEIREKTTELMTVGEKARTVDRLGDWSEDPRDVDVVAVVDRAVASVREASPSVSIEVDLPPSLTVTCRHPSLFEVIVTNLVENAAEHNDATDPRVRVSLVEASDETPTAVLTVQDNGPAIPDQELVPLTVGDETALRHGTSLGLWVVAWSVRRLGGTITFDTVGDRGNEITVSVPLDAVWDPPTVRDGERTAD